MANSRITADEQLVSRKVLLGGVVLAGVGALIGLVGFVLGGSALIAGAQRRIRKMDVPPSEIAKHKLAQAKAAAAAGVGGWQNGASEKQPVS